MPRLYRGEHETQMKRWRAPRVRAARSAVGKRTGLRPGLSHVPVSNYPVCALLDGRRETDGVKCAPVPDYGQVLGYACLVPKGRRRAPRPEARAGSLSPRRCAYAAGSAMVIVTLAPPGTFCATAVPPCA